MPSSKQHEEPFSADACSHLKQRYWIASNRLQLVRYFALNMFFCTKLSEKYLFLVNLYTVILTQIWIVWVSKNTWLFLKHYFKLTFSRISIAISLYYPTFMVVLKKNYYYYYYYYWNIELDRYSKHNFVLVELATLLLFNSILL